MKKLYKNPIKFNLYFLMLFPLIFIIIGIISFFSEDVRQVFYAPASLLGYLTGELFSKFGAEEEKVSRAITDLLCTYQFSLTAYILLLGSDIFSFMLLKRGNIKAYIIITVTECILWFCVWTLFYIQIGFWNIYSVGLIAIMILFLFTTFIISNIIGKAISIKPKENDVEVIYEED